MSAELVHKIADSIIEESLSLPSDYSLNAKYSGSGSLVIALQSPLGRDCYIVTEGRCPEEYDSYPGDDHSPNMSQTIV